MGVIFVKNLPPGARTESRGREPKAGKPAKRKLTELEKEQRQEQREALERQFLQAWCLLGGPPLRRQWEFHPTRHWRLDFAHRDSRVAIEVDGGTFIKGGGRHNRGRGYSADCEKLNSATALGWEVYRITVDMLTEDPEKHLGMVILRICERNSVCH